MGDYYLGNPVKMVETFTKNGVPKDPTTVSFRVRKPNRVLATYIFGADTEVTNPSVGEYICELVTDVAGEWLYEAEGTGAVIARSGTGSFNVIDSGVVPTVPLSQLATGPCQPWVDSQDVLDCCSAEIGSDTTILEASIIASSEMLYEASGRQFPGICERTVRPCRTEDCLFGVQVLSRGHLVNWNGRYWGDYECGCIHTPRVKLAGRVQEIIEVKIDGVVLDPAQYFVQDRRYLIRRAPHRWPQCQSMSKSDDEAGTWSVNYSYGKEPPALGQLAARAMACEIIKSCDPNAECAIPKGAVRVTRQGITFEKSFFVRQRSGPRSHTGSVGVFWATGIAEVDFFLNSINANGIPRRATFWSASQKNRYARPSPS